jgi:hypothetical protein
MTRRAKWMVYGLVAVVVLNSLYDIVFDTEHWPFSNYEMFSTIRRGGSTLTRVGVYAVPSDTALGEFPLLAAEQIHPFDQSRLAIAIGKLESSPRRLDQALGDLLGRYEARRQAGQHDGPRLRAVKLYEVTWTLDPWARNVEAPDQKRLLYQVPRNVSAAE